MITCNLKIEYDETFGLVVVETGRTGMFIEVYDDGDIVFNCIDDDKFLVRADQLLLLAQTAIRFQDKPKRRRIMNAKTIVQTELMDRLNNIRELESAATESLRLGNYLSCALLLEKMMEYTKFLPFQMNIFDAVTEQ